MTIESAVTWYDKNVNYKLTRAFLEFLIKIGIIKSEINIEMLNSFLFLVTFDLKLHVVETTRSEFFARDCKINIAFITKH